MYLSLSLLFVLSTINYSLAQVDSISTKDTQRLILATQVVIVLGIVARGTIDWLAKRKAHSERKELLALQKETAAKVDQNTEITKETTRNVRHDVRGEINAMSLLHQLEAQKLAIKVEEENASVRKRMEELVAMFRAAYPMDGSKAPQQVQVVNDNQHPVPVHGDQPVFPPRTEQGQQ